MRQFLCGALAILEQMEISSVAGESEVRVLSDIKRQSTNINPGPHPQHQKDEV